MFGREVRWLDGIAETIPPSPTSDLDLHDYVDHLTNQLGREQ